MYALYGADTGSEKWAVNKMRSAGWLNDSSMRGADLGEARLENVNLGRADLEEVNLTLAHARGVILSESLLDGSIFERADMREAKIAGASLQDTVFLGADLGGAVLDASDFTRADFERANLRNASLKNVLFSDANLHGVEVEDEQLAAAAGMAGATMPNGKRYDGRFNLREDLLTAEDEGIDLTDRAAMAAFYGVDAGVYEYGQNWAKMNAALLDAARPEPPEEAPIAEDLPNYRSPFDMLWWSFAEPEILAELRTIGDNRELFRDAGAWLVAFMLWLPGLLTVAAFAVQSILVEDILLVGGQQMYRTIATIAVLTLANIALIILSARVFRSKPHKFLPLQIVVLVLAFAFVPRVGITVVPVAVASYIMGLIVAHQAIGHAARKTMFWIGVIFISSAVLTPVFLVILRFLPRTSSQVVVVVVSAVLFLLRYTLGTGLTWLLQQGIKNDIVPILGDIVGRLFLLLCLVAYIGSIAWTLVDIVG